jgi:hypothetical protein
VAELDPAVSTSPEDNPGCTREGGEGYGTRVGCFPLTKVASAASTAGVGTDVSGCCPDVPAAVGTVEAAISIAKTPRGKLAKSDL